MPADFDLHNNPGIDTILVEKPIHRVIMVLKAAGMNNRQIEQALKQQGTPMSYANICIVCKQTWFLKGVVKIMAEKGTDTIEEILQTILKDAVEVAYTTMMDENVSLRDRTACAFELAKLARGNKVIIENKGLENADLAKLQEEQKRLEEDLSGLLKGAKLPEFKRN